MSENKELLNEYQKGYIHCLCNVIKRGSKKVSNDLDDLLFEVNASEDEFKVAVEEIVSQYDIKLYIEHYTTTFKVIEGDVGVRKRDGIIEKISGTTHVETYSLVLYKNQDDLDRFLELQRSERSDAEYHREMGKLFGYGDKEIEEFIAGYEDD